MDFSPSSEEGKNIGQRILDELAGEEKSIRPQKKLLPKEYFAAKKLFVPYSEIMKSYQSLENIKIYIGSFPYKNRKVKRDEYLRYHLENYLNELYILKNRLITYLKILSKAYNKSNLHTKVNDRFPKLFTLVSDSFKGYTNIRGVHVHQNRYKTFDLERLGAFEILTKIDDEKIDILRKYYNLVFKEIRMKWRKKIETDLKSINKLLEHYYGEIMGVIVENDKIIYPNEKWV